MALLTNSRAISLFNRQGRRITIPGIYTIIDTNAFVGLNISTVAIPDSVTRIKNGAFWGCENLSKVVFGKNTKTIGARSFSSSGLQKVKIPDSVTAIGIDAFKFNTITNVTINRSYGLGKSKLLKAFDNSVVFKVRSDESFSLEGKGHLQRLQLTGRGHINGKGNGLRNILIGNDGRNILNGKGGNDLMVGNRGNDTYYVNSRFDACVEDPNKGYDKIISKVSYRLPDNIEKLKLDGGGRQNGTGNSLGNKIIGNNKRNILKGLGGADTLTGGSGVDTFVYTDTSDSPNQYNGDLITDFNAFIGEKIDLSAVTSWADGEYNVPFEFIGNRQFSKTQGEVRVVRIPDSGGLQIILVNNDNDREHEMAIGFYEVNNQDIGAQNFIL